MLDEAKLEEEDYDNSGAKRSWGTSITVDGTAYATSLFWQPLQNTSDPFQEVEDASAGVLEGADLFCIKGGKAPQFGICVSHEGYKSGELVAAVALATAMSNVASYVAVFKTSEGWWYTCIRNDIILSDGDMLFLDEEEAKNQFMSMLAVPDWGKKIAPKEWGIEDTEEIDLGEIMQRGARAKLQKIKALRGTKLLLVVVLSAGIVIWLLSSLINQLFLTPQVRPIVVPVKPKVVQKQAPPPEPKPWEKMNNPETVMRECYDKITSLMAIMPPGWQLGDLTCTPSGVSTSWRRELGRIIYAEKALDKSKLTFSGRTFSGDGNTLSVTLPLAAIEQRMSAPTINAVDLQNQLNDLFQKIGHPISLSMTTYKSPQGKVYRMLAFKITSTHNPLTWMPMLIKYSGLDIKVIKYSPGSKNWDYEGTIYVL